MNSISVIGCGMMGRVVIQTLAAHNQNLVIWNRTREKALTLVRPGITVAESFTYALAASPVIILILSDPNYAVATDLLTENRTLLAGKTIVQLSTGTPINARTLSAFVTDMGGDYLDGGILVIPSMVGTAQAKLVYSGSYAAFKRLEPVLSLLGASSFQSEEPGAAAILDMAYNVAITPTVIAVLQGLKICEREKLPARHYVDLLRGCFIDYILTEVEWEAQGLALAAKEHEYTNDLLKQVVITLCSYLKSLQLDTSMLDAAARLSDN